MTSDYDQRQYRLMQEALAAYRENRMVLGNLIDRLSALLEVLEEASAEWKDAFRSEWWTLEQVNAVAIDRGQDPGSEQFRGMVNEAVSNLDAMVQRALA